MQRTKKAVSLLLSVLLVFSCFTCLASVTAFAADGDSEPAATFMYGDVNGDGRVSIDDATTIQRHIAKMGGWVLQEGTDAFKAADVDGNGEISVNDVTTIQRYLAEFIDHFPVEDIVPTTEEPITEELTTEEPTTEEPTTEEPVEDDTYIVAGSEAEIFGTGWDGNNEDNTMTKAADGTWTKDYTVDKAYEAVQLKTVKNGSDWIGDETGNNVTFNLNGAGTFTVVYDPETNVTSVRGENVEFITEFNYDTVFAVGNGEGYWLNGASWDPAYATNEMTQVADDVWEIEFRNVPDGFERQIKFAIDGAWTHNFGAPDFEDGDDMNNHIGEEMEAKYNSSNITFDTEDVCTVKAQLDLRDFNFATKTGAKFTLDIIYDDEPIETTEEPTTEEPTTEEPTTEEPTTEEPTTEEPTTEEPVEEDTYIVAGSEAEIFGTGWDGNNADNTMTKAADGTWTKDYTVDKAYEAVQLKTVKNGSDWIGDETGNNVTFNLNGAGTFTVVYDPETNVTSVKGDNVEFITEFNYETVYAVGNGEGYWLNGASWDPAYATNEMTQVADDVWEIEFRNVPDGFERQIKFAIDGAWTHNFGAPDFEDGDDMNNHIGEEMEAKYNSSNITFDTEDVCTVKAQLDLRDFNFATKTGAKFTLDIIYDDEPIETTEEPTTEEPTTEEPTTEEPTTEEPTTEEPTTEEPTTEEPVEDDTYIVAGSEAEIFGTGWDGNNEDNKMTKAADGTWTKDYTVDKAYEAVQLKTVKNGSDWIGDETGNNVTFNLTGAGTFTVVYDPETNVTSVRGDNVEFITEFNYDTVFAVGNGEGYWLNGASWDPAYAANEMTQVADDVWEIEFRNVPDGFERQIKFAIDGAWTHNFGAPDFEDGDDMNNHIGEWMEAKYNSSNITFDTEDICTVKVTLDLTKFDFVTKTGAKFKLDVVYAD